ncbi:hypothetical protein J4221_07560 [Candidatus Pacearchaeota archaeon]|nr:hypothetical protein [Candidatus Pacearchaeota archaeon]
MEKFFIGEYILSKDKELSDFSELPNIELIRNLAEKYKDKLELMPVQILGKEVELGLAVYLNPKRGTKKEKYVTVINKELFPKDKTLLIKFLKKGLNNLKSFKNNIFTEESYQNAINLIKEIIKNFN